MYKIVLQRNQYATVKLNGKEIECLSGLFVTTADLAELDLLVRLANRGAAEQKMHPTKNGRAKSDSESKPAVFSG